MLSRWARKLRARGNPPCNHQRKKAAADAKLFDTLKEVTSDERLCDGWQRGRGPDTDDMKLFDHGKESENLPEVAQPHHSTIL